MPSKKRSHGRYSKISIDAKVKTKKAKKPAPVQKYAINHFEATGGGAGKKGRIRKSAQPKAGNLNVKRALPSQFIKNNKVIVNSFKPKLVATEVKKITCFFSSYSALPNGDLESNLIKHLSSTIETYGYRSTIVGCVAWLKHRKILSGLCNSNRCLLVINSEKYDTWGGGKMKDEYKKLPRFLEPLYVAFEHLEGVLSALETNRKTGSGYAAVRTFGNPSMTTNAKYNKGLEHCKYLVFFKKKPFVRNKLGRYEPAPKIVSSEGGSEKTSARNVEFLDVPCAVWTGSMNMTHASETHHENAIFIEDEKIAMAYFRDFENTFAVSKPLK